MSIIAIYTDVPGQINTPNIRRVKLIVTDDLSTITTAGYLNPSSLQGYNIYNTDIIQVWYGAVATPAGVTSPGTFQEFTPSIDGATGQITLVPWVNLSNVLLPVVSGNLASFNGTTGQIEDSGLALATVNSAISQLGTLQQLSVTLVQADVTGMYAAPVEIVAAPGAGKVIVPISATLYTNFQTAAFSSGGVAILQYDSTVHGAGTNSLTATFPAAEITAAASQIYRLAGEVGGAVTGVTNKGLYFSNQTGAFAGGNAASTLVVNVVYTIIDATI